jgi:hypothetical protein
MPIRISHAIGAAVPACAVAALIAIGAGTANAAVVAHVRVLTPKAVLEQGRSYVTGSESIRTDPNAHCFLGGSGGSGDVVDIPGATALGIVRSALRTNKALDPISVTDEFGFGLGVCGFGGYQGNESRYWSLNVNHSDPGVGGDHATLHEGDTVLWYLTDYPQPPELDLRAPAGTDPGGFQVRVLQHTCETGPPPDYQVTCGAHPAVGATVTGGSSGPVTAGADGRATATAAGPGRLTLAATLDGDIPAEPVDVCVDPDPSACPTSHGEQIIGRPKADAFAGTAGWDAIRSRGGDDSIDLRDGGHDRVDCGGGDDKVIVDAGDDDDRLDSSCERVVKR